jgi:hypothetical protein
LPAQSVPCRYDLRWGRPATNRPSARAVSKTDQQQLSSFSIIGPDHLPHRGPRRDYVRLRFGGNNYRDSAGRFCHPLSMNPKLWARAECASRFAESDLSQSDRFIVTFILCRDIAAKRRAPPAAQMIRLANITWPSPTSPPGPITPSDRSISLRVASQSRQCWGLRSSSCARQLDMQQRWTPGDLLPQNRAKPQTPRYLSRPRILLRCQRVDFPGLSAPRGHPSKTLYENKSLRLELRDHRATAAGDL